MINNKLLKKYTTDTSCTADRCFIYSYAKDAKEPIVFAHYKNGPGKKAKVSHSNNSGCYSLYVIVSGDFEVTIGERVYSSLCGNAIVVTEHEEISATFNSDYDADYYEINFPREFFDSISAKNPFYELFYERDQSVTNFIKLPPALLENAIDKLRETEALIKADSRNTDMIAYANIIQLTGILLAQYDETTNYIDTHKLPDKLREAIGYIQKNYLTLSGVDEVASCCGITGTYLARMFKSHILCSPNEYITALRISYAKQMLKNGASLTDACYKSGFNSYTYFISKFKKATGVTPYKYKK